MYNRPPDFIDDLNEHEKALVAACARGEVCDLVDKGAAFERFDQFKAEEEEKPDKARRSDATLVALAIRSSLEVPDAPVVRAPLIRFLALGGDKKHPVDPYGVRLRGARITGTLSLDGCRGLRTLGLDCCEIAEIPVLRDAEGQTISFDGSRIPGLKADRLDTTGGVFLRNGFEATGAVSLSGAQIGGNLECDGGRFSDAAASGNALFADGLSVAGDVYLRNGFEAAEAVRLSGAQIRGALDCTGGRFDSKDTAINVQSAEVLGGIFWRAMAPLSTCIIDLTNAKTSFLADDAESWPVKGKLILNGFRYDRIAEGPTGFAARKEWLERQVETHLSTKFKPQPFEQLAKVLRETGHGEDAAQISMLKRDYERRARWISALQRLEATFEGLADLRAQRRIERDADEIERLDREIAPKWWRCLMSPFSLLRDYGVWLLSWLFKRLIGYGYRPLWAVGWSFGFILCGLLVFQGAEQSVSMVPNNPFLLKKEWADALGTADPYAAFAKAVPDFQPFEPIIYSIDTFVPLVNLHQETHWIPQPEGKPGAWSFSRLYLWVHIAMGWVITTLLVASLTGVVKKDV